MPFGMGDYVQSVMVEGKVYVGGGHTGHGNDNNYIVMTYNIFTRKWATLPPYRASDFAMTVINNQLVLVGGMEQDYNRIKALGVWDSEQWTHPYPEMDEARSSCSAVSYNEWLVVAGGESTDHEDISVEVMNTNSEQWYFGPPTPTPWSFMRTAVVGDTCYFMGGIISTNEMYSVSLSALVSGLSSDVEDARESNSLMWKVTSGFHLMDSTPLSIGGSLLAVGGEVERNKSTTAIHLYQPYTGKWVKVGDLPTPRRDCTCAMITNKEMLVAGGGDGINYPDILKSTVIALLK